MGNVGSNKLMAETLGITLDTAKKHVRNVIDKLQARSRTHAAIIAAQAGVVGNLSLLALNLNLNRTAFAPIRRMSLYQLHKCRSGTPTLNKIGKGMNFRHIVS
jgi:hypothetical protein